MLSEAPSLFGKNYRRIEQRNLDLVNLFKKAYSTLETKKAIQTGTRVVETCKKWSESLRKRNARIKTKGSSVQSFDHVTLGNHIALSSLPEKNKSSQIKKTEFIELGMLCW